jgi:hypothetical protein
MTTESWSKRHDAARDEAWRAWRRIDVEPYDIMGVDSEPPPALKECATGIATAISPLFLRVTDEVDAELDHEARLNIVAAALARVVLHLPWAVVEAVADELSRPKPIPFAAPPARSWLRVRYTGDKWLGKCWHVFSGDLRVGDARAHDVVGSALCGARLPLRSIGLRDGEPFYDYVLATERPEVDACRRCFRISDPEGFRARPPIPDVFLY